jgi:hypothetical protein
MNPPKLCQNDHGYCTNKKFVLTSGYVVFQFMLETNCSEKTDMSVGFISPQGNLRADVQRGEFALT